MNRSALVLAVAAAWGLAACASPLRPGITVYTKRDFGGARETLHGAVPDLRDVPGFEDEISSFEIHRGVWQLCKLPGYRDCRVTDRSMADLGEWDLDNAISSLRPVDRDADYEYGERYEDERYDEDRYERRYEEEREYDD